MLKKINQSIYAESSLIRILILLAWPIGFYTLGLISCKLGMLAIGYLLFFIALAPVILGTFFLFVIGAISLISIIVVKLSYKLNVKWAQSIEEESNDIC